MSRTASYDFLLVGTGLFNAVFANEAAKKGKKSLVVERGKHQLWNVTTPLEAMKKIEEQGQDNLLIYEMNETVKKRSLCLDYYLSKIKRDEKINEKKSATTV